MKKGTIAIMLLIFSLLSGFAFGVLNVIMEDSKDHAELKEKLFDEAKDSMYKRVDPFAASELIAVLKLLKNSKSIQAKFNVRLFNLDQNHEFESFEGEYIRNSDGYTYISSFESENLMSKDYFIAVDHAEKMIYVEKPEFIGSGNISSLNLLFELDSIVNFHDSSIVYAKMNENTSKLSVFIETSSYYQVDIIYETTTKRISKLILYPFQDIFIEPESGEIGRNITINTNNSVTGEIPGLIVIEYSKLECNADLSPLKFDYKRYFDIKEGKLTVNRKYKNYEIDYE
jgi:hypothetical protein